MDFAFRKAGLIAGIFFLSQNAQATTFGPIPVVEQIRSSQYVVRGHVMGSSWVEMEPRIQRPYTYWKLAIIGQPVGESLGAQVIIRQPGGEIGDMGYHMAGTAEFANGEDVFVPLHDTEQAPNIKEVVGLASGKYKVEKHDGKEVVMSGLGLPVTRANGEKLDSDKFMALLKRISQNQATEDDRSIFVNRLPVHEHDPALEAQTKEVENYLKRQPSTGNSDTATTAASVKDQLSKSETRTEVIPQEGPQKSEELPTGSSVGIWALALGVAGLLIGLFFLLRK